MRKIVSFLIVSLGLFLGGCSLTTSTTTVTTNPITLDPLEIWTVEDLLSLESTQDGVLMADLDLTGIVWTPLFSHATPYSANFDGNSHTITNMSISVKNTDYNGLFAEVSGTVKDLFITNFDISYTTNFVTYAGGLTGYLSGEVTNVVVSGDIDIRNTASSSYVGLLAGVAQVFVDTTTTAQEFVPNTVSMCDVSGTVQVTSEFFAYVGGLFGKSYNYEILQNTVDVSLDVTAEIYRAYVGGLVGHHYGGILIGFEDYVDTTDIFISQNVVFSVILVTSNGTHASVGGLIGYDQYGIMYDNFAISEINASGNELYIGSLLGEDWYGSLSTSVGVSDYNVVETEGQMLFLSSIIGYGIEEGEVTDNYYYVISNTTYDQVDGTSVSLVTLGTDTFYQTDLGWSLDDFNFDLLTSNLPQ